MQQVNPVKGGWVVYEWIDDRETGFTRHVKLEKSAEAVEQEQPKVSVPLFSGQSGSLGAKKKKKIMNFRVRQPLVRTKLDFLVSLNGACSYVCTISLH